MDLLGLGLISGAASLGSGILNNIGISRQNDAAADQYRQGLAFNRQMMYEQSRLNSPENQVRRFRNAGINPAFAMYGGASAGEVGAPSAPSSTSSYSSPDFSFMPSSASNLLQGLSGVSLTQSQVKNAEADTALKESQKANQDIKNLWEDEENRSRIYNRDSLSWIQDIQSDIAKLQLSYDKQSLGDRLFMQKWQSEQMRANAMSSLIAAKYAEQEHQQQLKNGIAQAYMAYASGQASLKQAHTMMLESFAKYGKDDSQRGEFFKQSLNNLREVGNLSVSQQYGNWLAGAKMSLGVGSFELPYRAGLRKAKAASRRHY